MMVILVMEAVGVEPTKHYADDLKSPSFDHLDILPIKI